MMFASGCVTVIPSRWIDRHGLHAAQICLMMTFSFRDVGRCFEDTIRMKKKLEAIISNVFNNPPHKFCTYELKTYAGRYVKLIVDMKQNFTALRVKQNKSEQNNFGSYTNLGTGSHL